MFQNALFQIMRMDVSDLPETLKAITEIDARVMGAERVSVWFFNPARDAIVCEDLYRLTEGVHEKGLVLKATDYPAYFECLERQLAIVANDARGDPQVREFCENYLIPFGITSMMDVPIWLEGRVIGIICHEHVGKPRAWTDEEQEFATSIGHIISISLSVSERLKAEAELVRTNEELRMLNEARLAFTSMVSHELRTPLSSIKAGLDMVLQGVDGPLTESQRETLSISKSNVDRLSRLIDNILDFTRMEAGKMEMYYQRTCLNLLLEEAHILMKMEAEKRKISLNLHLPRTPVDADCDADKMKTVVINLIHNAVKFTPEGGRIGVELGVAGESAKITVRDTGLGIAPEAQSRIFQMFRQGNKGGMWKAGGSGVGLAVCKFITEAHQGAISVESAPGKGSVFTVLFPLRRKEPPSPSRPA